MILVLWFLSCSSAPKFDGERAFADLKRQCDFGPRSPNSQAHLDTEEFLFSSLKLTTDLCRKQEFSYFDSLTVDTLHLTNLIASYNQSNPRRIMICAHWDSRPWADQDSDSTYRNQPIPGANDGASGVAVLLELGRIFKAKPPPIGIDIVLFDGEDYGKEGRDEGWFLGSKYFSQNLNGYRPRFAILLDMIGDSYLQIYREAYSQKNAGEINDYIWDIARENKVPNFIDSIKHSVLDDHIPLLMHGIRAIDLIDFDYPPWHTHEDTPDKCSPKSLAAVGKVLVASIYNKRINSF